MMFQMLEASAVWHELKDIMLDTALHSALLTESVLDGCSVKAGYNDAITTRIKLQLHVHCMLYASCIVAVPCRHAHMSTRCMQL